MAYTEFEGALDHEQPGYVEFNGELDKPESKLDEVKSASLSLLTPKKSIADQAGEQSASLASTAAPQVSGVPIRRDYYNKAVAETPQGLSVPDTGIVSRVRNIAANDKQAQLGKRTVGNAFVSTEPDEGIGLIGTLKEGAKGTARNIGAAIDTGQGNAGNVVSAANDARSDEKDPVLEALLNDINARKKALGENPGWIDSIKAVGGAAINNPKGAGLLLAEQLPNSAVALGSGAAGAAAGSIFGPAGTVIGGIAGLFGANTALETGGKAIEAAADGRFSPAEQRGVLEEGAIKGGVITGVDASTLGLTNFIMGTTARAVERATVKTLADHGVDVSNKAAVLAASKNPAIVAAVQSSQKLAQTASDTLGKKLARVGGATGLETVGEGAGEYLGEMAATGKADKVDAVIEALSSLGQSAGEIAFTAARNKAKLSTIAGKPVEQLSDSVLRYTANRGSERAKAAAQAELDRRATQGVDPEIANAPESTSDAVDRIIATGKDKADEIRARAPDAIQSNVLDEESDAQNAAASQSQAAPDAPTQEPVQTLNAQLNALAEGRKPGMLLTPGEPMPHALPPGVKAAEIPGRGVLLYRDEETLQAALNGQMGTALGYGIDEKPAQTNQVVTARDANGTVIQDVATDGRPEVAQAATAVAGPNGTVETRPIQDAMGERAGKAKSSKGFEKFHADSGTLGIPRADMPQVPTQSHGGLVNHLNAQGIDHETKVVPTNELKPTQAEFSPEKVKQAKEATGDRAIIVSNDGHIIDGHHQALAAHEQGKNVKAIVLDAPVDQALEAVKNSPSAQPSSRKVGNDGAVNATQAAHPLRPLVESLIKRRAAAKQGGKDLSNAIARAKEVMEGKRTDATVENRWFRLQAKAFEKADAEAASILRQIGEAVQPREPSAGAPKFSRSASSKDFVSAPDGSINFGEITKEIGSKIKRQAAPIRLPRGVQNGDGTGYGLAHIEANHGKEIRNAGFESVESFVAHVAKNFNEVLHASGRQILVAVKNGRQDVMFVQLEPSQDGDYYRINTAFPTIRAYVERQMKKGMKVLWSGSEPALTVTGQQPAYAANPETSSSQDDPTARGQSDSNIPEDDPKFNRERIAEVRTRLKEASLKAKQATSPGGLSVSDEHKSHVQVIVDAIRGGWKNAPEIIVVRDMHDPVIPERVRSVNTQQMSQGDIGQPEGFFYKGKVYIVSSEMYSPRDVVRVVFHETLGHYGLRGVFGDELKPILKQIAALRRADVEKKAKQYGLDMSIEKDRLIAAEEVLAEMAQTNPQVSFVKRAIAAIRAWLRKNIPALADMKMTDDEIIHSYLIPAREFVRNGRGGTVKDTPVFSRKPGSTFDSPEPSRLDTLIHTLQDKNIDLKRVTEAIKKTGKQIADNINAYLQEELFHGRSATRVKEFIDTELDPLIKLMRVNGVKMADFEEYLWARHAEERNEQIAKINPGMPDGGSGMSTKDARDYLAKLDPKQKALYEALAKRVDAINRKSRQVLVDYGLESQKTIDTWESAYQHYVPLMREDMDHAFGNGTGQGFSVKGNATKRATGSKRPVVDILANIAQQREKYIIRGEKNRVATALIGLAKENPNPDFWKVDVPPTIRDVNKTTGLVEERTDPLYKQRDNIIVARIPDSKGNIQERSVIFNEHDPRALRMAQSLKNLDQDQVGAVLNASSIITRYFASINTQYNPIFGIVNLTRDVQGAMLNLTSTPLAGKKKVILSRTGPALLAIYQSMRGVRKGNAVNNQWSQLWEEFQKEGGKTGFRDMYKNAQDRAEALEQGLNPDWWQTTRIGKVITAGGLLNAPEKVIADKAVKPLFDWLSDYNDSMENAVRLAAYKTGLEQGMSKQQAASLAKNLTVNFNKRGAAGRQIGALYAFFNASVQGTARLAETMKGPAGKKIVTGGILLGGMQAMLLAMAGMGDDEPPEFVKSRSLIIPIGDGKYLSVPMPLGFNVLPNIGRITSEFVMSGFKDPAKRTIQMMDSVLDAFNPVGNAGMSLQTIAPTAIDPLAALAENKDWTGKPIAREDFNSMNPTPGFTRAKDTASVFSKLLAEGINKISGGTKYQPGALSPTPDQIDYLISQATGGVGREYLKAEQTVTSAFTGEELPPHKVPLLGRFYGDTKGQSSQGAEFYDNLKRLNGHEAEIKGRMKNREDVAEYKRDNPEWALIAAANGAEKRVQELRKRKRELVEQGAPKERIKMIDEVITATMKSLNEKVRQRASATAH